MEHGLVPFEYVACLIDREVKPQVMGLTEKGCCLKLMGPALPQASVTEGKM